MFYFHMPEIVVTGIIDDIRYAVIIMRRDILVTGKLVRNVDMILRQRCMYIMVQMNIILKNWKIPRSLNQQGVLNVMLLLFSVREDIQQMGNITFVLNAQRINSENLKSNKRNQGDLTWLSVKWIDF